MSVSADEPGPKPPATASYRVTIFYREPHYARMRGIPDNEYRGSFDVTAGNEDDAVSLALARFKDAAQRSGVSWAREPTRVSCLRTGDRSDPIGRDEASRAGEPADRAAPATVLDFDEAFESNPDLADGCRVFRGTRVTVRTVLASLARGEGAEDILKAFPTLTPAHLRAAIAYAAVSALMTTL